MRTRVSRLLPPVFIVLSASYLLQALTDFAPGINLFTDHKLATLLSYFGDITILGWPMGLSGLNTPTWSLWVEFRFYLLIALIIQISSKKSILIFSTNIWLYLTVLHQASPLPSPLRQILLLDNFNYQGNSGSAVFFIIGIYLGIYHLPNSQSVLLPLFFSLIISIPQVMFLISTIGSPTKSNYIFGMIIYALVVICVFFSKNIKLRSLTIKKYLSVFGRSTYCIYLLHYFLGAYLIMIMATHEIKFPKLYSLAVIIVLSFIWTLFFEFKLSQASFKLLFNSKKNS